MFWINKQLENIACAQGDLDIIDSYAFTSCLHEN